jgi:hypothetical protein
MGNTFADRVLAFHHHLPLPRFRVRGVKALDPFSNQVTRELAQKFYHKYYGDNAARIFVFGINPGRFGAGMTGVPFTDPIRLQNACGIDNGLPKKQELSSVYVYSFIERWGGVGDFFRQFFVAAVCPVGFVRDGLNYNYYDDPRLLRSLEPFILESMHKQIAIGARREAVIVLGLGRNLRYFETLNREHGFFEKVLAVEHPRFIMQYRRKRLDEFLERYRDAFARAVSLCDKAP